MPEWQLRQDGTVGRPDTEQDYCMVSPVPYSANEYVERQLDRHAQELEAACDMVPALGYLIQYDRLVKKAKKGQLTTAEVELMINGFDQAEFYQYEQARELSIALLREWLANYKFKNWTTTETRKLPVTDQMRRNRAAEIAKELNKTEKWHVHGHGISMEVLRRDLNLRIDDFGADSKMSALIKQYHNLLSDYMAKRGNGGVLHAVGTYLPFM